MYIGKTPTVGNFQVCDAISVVNGQAAYTLQVGGTNVAPESANHMLVSLNGILQKPGSSFTISGSTMTFASNLATGDVIDFVQILGNVLDLGVPSDATVTTAKLGDNAVSSAKMFSGFANGITEADQWRLTANFTNVANPIASNFERVDTAGQGYFGTGMSVSSGVWTFPSTGVWLVEFNHYYQFKDGNALSRRAAIEATADNSSYITVARLDRNGFDEGYDTRSTSSLIDVTNTSLVKVKFSVTSSSTNDITLGSTTHNYTYFTFIRLGDT